jgi:uncharacterized membrane protein YjjB (DUF3815 family)
MMNLLLDILPKAFWCGCGALGFAVLFNTPGRALLPIYLCGFMAGFIKFSVLHPMAGGGPIIASMAAASAVGFASLPMAHWRHVPPVIISIPSVIPLVPGSAAYRTMLGLIKYIRQTDLDVLGETFHNGLLTLFIILALALGVTLPMLLFRIDSAKNVRLLKPGFKDV